MSRTIKLEATNSSLFKGFADPDALGSNRTERHNLVLYELDKDYHRQLKHLKRIAQKARLSFLEFNQPHTTGLDERAK